MITYSTGLSTLLKLTGVASADTTNSAFLIQFWNDSRRTVAGMNGGKWPWLEIDEYVTTTASQEYVEVPNHIQRVMAVRQINPGTAASDPIYLPRLVFDSSKWDTVLALNLGSSDVPNFVYHYNQRLYIRPIPSSGSNRIYMRGRLKTRDINIADYTTGNILTATLDSTALVGTGTSWTASMAGRWLRITESDTANKGDGYWYQVASVTDTTHLTLKKPYQGTSIAAGSAAYTLGLITYEPEPYHMAPIYRAAAQWWDSKENMVLSERYWRLYDGGFEIGKVDEPGGLIGQMLSEANESMEGPYISPWNRNDGWPYAPYYYPWDDASGF